MNAPKIAPPGFRQADWDRMGAYQKQKVISRLARENRPKLDEAERVKDADLVARGKTHDGRAALVKLVDRATDRHEKAAAAVAAALAVVRPAREQVKVTAAKVRREAGKKETADRKAREAIAVANAAAARLAGAQAAQSAADQALADAEQAMDACRDERRRARRAEWQAVSRATAARREQQRWARAAARTAGEPAEDGLAPEDRALLRDTIGEIHALLDEEYRKNQYRPSKKVESEAVA